MWRIHPHVPAKGMFQLFNRSYYEDVVVTRVYGWCDDALASKRFEVINNFEKLLVQHNNTLIFKFYLHISPEEQKERFAERKENPAKQWKYKEKDELDATYWQTFMNMYEEAFAHCSEVPWVIVPSDQNWYKEYIIAKTLVKGLRALDMKYPQLNK